MLKQKVTHMFQGVCWQFTEAKLGYILLDWKDIDVSEAAGPDGISAGMLKETTTTLSLIIITMFIMSLVSGTLPYQWNASLVILIPKSGDPSTSDQRCCLQNKEGIQDNDGRETVVSPQ